VTSVAGLHGNAGQVNYSTAKAGIVGLTKDHREGMGPAGCPVVMSWRLGLLTRG